MLEIARDVFGSACLTEFTQVATLTANWLPSEQLVIYLPCLLSIFILFKVIVSEVNMAIKVINFLP